MNQKTAKLLRKYAAAQELPLGPLRQLWMDTPKKMRGEFRRTMKRGVG